MGRPQSDFLGHGPWAVLNASSSDRLAFGSESAIANSRGKNFEKRKVELWFEGGEVGIEAWDGGNKGEPLGPHGVLVGGSFRRDSRAGRRICSAQISEESIAGRRVTSCQGWACGQRESK